MRRVKSMALALLVAGSLYGCSYTNSVMPTAEDILVSDAGSAKSSDTEAPDPNPAVSSAESTPADNAADSSEAADQTAIEALVADFGAKLRQVSLLNPDAGSAIEENYGEFVDPALLKKWQEDPENAPGRLVSSPWPNRIEISEIGRNSDGTYLVSGEIVEVTSAEAGNGGAAAKRAVTLHVANTEGKWLIDDATLGDYVTGETGKTGETDDQTKG